MEGVPAALRDVCKLDSSLVPEMELAGQHISSEDPLLTYQAAKDVVYRSSSTTSHEHELKSNKIVHALCFLHAMDYACFHDHLPMPSVCHEVLNTDFLND